MTPLMRLARKLVEKMLGTYYEGPEPPARLDEAVDAFFDERPDAAPDEIVDFCVAHAREAYRAGFERGYEHAERDEDRSSTYRRLDPERHADALDPGWRHRTVAQAEDELLDDPPTIAASLSREGVEAMLRGAKGGRRGQRG